MDYWSELAKPVVTRAPDGRDMSCQRQLTVDDNTEVASGVRDGDASAEYQDVTAVNLVQQLTRAEPQQLRLKRSVQPKSAHTQTGVVVCDTCSELANCQRDTFDGRAEVHLAVIGVHV